MKRKVLFYKTKDGKCPIRDFLDALTGKVAQKIIWVLNLIEDLEAIPSIYFKKLPGSKDIWECRIQLGSNMYRIFCFFEKGAVIVLTHGIIKKGQKIPRREIDKAEKYRRDYLRRRKNE